MNFAAIRPWLIMALIFLLGGATGSVLTLGLGLRFRAPGPQEMRNHWMHHLASRLHLSDDQQTKIEPIIRQAEDEILSAHRDDLVRISGIMQKANADMKPFLNADQQAQLDQMEKDRERMFSPHMHGSGRPSGP